MDITNRNNFYYLRHSFRKNGKVTHREKYLGKKIPDNIIIMEQNFLRMCLNEDAFIKINKIKKEFLIEWKRFPESIKKKNLIDLSINFTYNSNAIEGSTITLDETKDLIERKISPNKKPFDETIETKNHSKVFFNVIQDNENINLEKIKKWHYDLFIDTKKDIAGQIRDYSVRVGDYRAPDWQDLQDLLTNFFVWLNKNKQIMHPIELAARAHYKFEKIHPFGDGNGRIGRFIIVNILFNYNFPILIIDYNK